MEELRTSLVAFAVAVSLASLYLSRKLWLQSNRPIVTAAIVDYASGNMGAVFNLVVSNTGNRPATNVRLNAKPEDINKLMVASVEEGKRQSIYNCFSNEAMISLLKNGEELTTSFGSISHPRSKDQWLKYGAKITIEITYDDLEGRSYRSIVPLKVYAREGFGGGVWK
jgi:hypothetical protein